MTNTTQYTNIRLPSLALLRFIVSYISRMLRCLGIEMKFFCVTVLSLTVTIQSPFQADFNLTWSVIHACKKCIRGKIRQNISPVNWPVTFVDDNSAESESTLPQPKPRNKRQRAASVYIEATSLKAVAGAETKTLLHKVEECDCWCWLL